MSVGIYKITNLINNKIYIGQSVDIERRYQDHLRFANNKNSREYHTSIHNAIRKYGINNFKLEIIEQCNKEDLDIREQYWISYYNSTNRQIGYNLTKGGLGGAKIQPKPVLQYDLKGNFIKEWSSIKQASEELNISENNIRACCCGQKSAGNYQWKYVNDIKIITEYKRNVYLKGLELGRCPTHITATSLKNHQQYNFDSISEAAHWLKNNQYTKANNLNGVCSRISNIKDTDKTGYGFLWKTNKEGDD